MPSTLSRRTDELTRHHVLLLKRATPALLPLVALLLLSCNLSPQTTPVSQTTVSASPTRTTVSRPVQEYTYQVVASYPHDPDAFTQGLVFNEGVLYEGTGLVGRSSLRKVDLETGRVLQRRDLPAPHFGEGIAVVGDRIFQLTWQSKVGFVYERNTFDPIGQFTYDTEGWGLTYDGKRLIMSDGTANLHFLDPATLGITGSVEVRDATGPVVRLNELEFINGQVYANVWQTDLIVIIDPDTGSVTGRVDLTGLLGSETHNRAVDVLNGVAYDAAADRLIVTGKLWPQLFEIKVLPTR